MALQTDQFWTDLKVDLTPDTVDVRTSATVNDYGERTFSGGATTYDCWIRRAEVAERDIDERIVIEWVVYIPDDSLTLNVDDQLTLGAPVSATRPVVRADSRRDETGQVAVVAYVGR